MNYTYIDVPTVVSVNPKNIMQLTTETINIKGNFSTMFRNFSCLIDGHIISAVLNTNNDTISCVSPELLIGNYSIEISSNQIEWFVLTDQLTVRDFSKITAIAPTHGPVEGGTVVNIYGYFLDISNATCLFNTTKSIPTHINSSQITCVSPNFTNPETVTVNVEFAHGQTALSSSTFTYIELSILHNIVPQSGFVNGSTDVFAIGEKFDPKQNLQCIFGGSSVQGIVLSPNLVIMFFIDKICMSNVLFVF